MSVPAITVARGRYAGANWPQVVACSFAGCVMRHRADTATEPWTCDDHADPYRDSHAGEVVADVLAESTHRELTEPPTRRYALQPSPRLDPDWTHDAP